MKTTWMSGLAVVLCGAMVAPRAEAQNREHQQLTAEVRMLQEQAQQLALTLAALNETLKTINTRIDESNGSMRKGFADQKLSLDNVASDVRVVRERTDDSNVRIATLREELEALRTSVVELQQAVVTAATAATVTPIPGDPNRPPDPTSSPVTPPPPAPAVTLPPTAGLSPTRLLESARSDYFAGQYTLAITGFEQFLKTFPKSEFAGEAQHLIGESYANQSRWPEAIAAYGLVVQNYPTSTFVPEAYYKRGIALERSGQIDAARASWETVVRNFPESSGAQLAKQSLDRLGRQRPAQ
jgi:tol-pal system protein YbgF